MPDSIDFPRAERDTLIDYQKDVKGCHSPVRVRIWRQYSGPRTVVMVTLPYDRIAAAVIVADIRRRLRIPEGATIIEHRQPTKDQPDHSFWLISGSGAQLTYTRMTPAQIREAIDAKEAADVK